VFLRKACALGNMDQNYTVWRPILKASMLLSRQKHWITRAFCWLKYMTKTMDSAFLTSSEFSSSVFFKNNDTKAAIMMCFCTQSSQLAFLGVHCPAYAILNLCVPAKPLFLCGNQRFSPCLVLTF
jgi:hypothetical protein